jgi:energy-converting hydrogenase Eha subunit E
MIFDHWLYWLGAFLVVIGILTIAAAIQEGRSD